MKLKKVLPGAGAVAVWMAASGMAQAQAPGQDVSPTAVAADATDADSIVVTARRREELLQDVPQTVNVVTGDTVQNLAINKFEDLQQIVPGSSFSGSTSGTLAVSTIRGVSYSAQSGAPGTVTFYLNNSVIDGNLALQNTYDLGQIEFLRGPQGTLRGRSAPSGAITITTHRPDLDEFGGYANGTFTSQDGVNMQGAVNVPVIENVLGLRVAGVIDSNNLDDVHSLHNSADPKEDSQSGRVSLRFTPTQQLTFDLTYQRLGKDSRGFSQVTGIGLNPLVNPAISPTQRLAVSDGENLTRQAVDFYIAEADWDLGPASLNYVGSRIDFSVAQNSTQDNGNILAGVELFQNVSSVLNVDAHELRLTSNEPVAGIVDYTVGAFYTKGDAVVAVDIPGIFSLPSTLSSSSERSVFANLNLHLGEKTELAGGARYLKQESNTHTNDTNYTIWTASITHHLSDNVVLYANAGTSFRQADSFALSAAFAAAPSLPGLQEFIHEKPETSIGYEIGAKVTAFDRRLAVNASVFHQKFDNFYYLTQSVFYNNPSTAGTDQARFTTNADAIVDGFDLDGSFRISRAWTIGAAAEYVDGHLDNALIPCNDGNGDGVDDGGVPSFPVAGPNPDVAQCASGGPISPTPNWNVTVSSEYSHPLAENFEGFIRGFYTFYPENHNQGTPGFTADAYGVLNLFVGLRSPDGRWEVMAFAKNALDDDTVLSRGAAQYGIFTLPIASGYFPTSVTREREFGISLRAAFGSR